MPTSYIYNDSQGDHDVGNSLNWTPSGVPVSGDTITTMGTGTANKGTIASGITFSALGTATLTGTLVVASLIIAGNTAYTISAGTYTGGITQSSGFGTISGGTFTGTCAIKRSVTGATFGATAVVTLTVNGALGAGCASIAGATIAVSTASVSLGISAGTYAGAVTNNNGRVTNGTYNGAFTNNASANGTVGGTFNGTVTDAASAGLEMNGCTFGAASTYANTAAVVIDYDADGVGNNTFGGTAAYAIGCSMSSANGNTYAKSVTFNTTVFYSATSSTDPGVTNVKSGTGYLINGVSKTGTLAAGGDPVAQQFSVTCNPATANIWSAASSAIVMSSSNALANYTVSIPSDSSGPTSVYWRILGITNSGNAPVIIASGVTNTYGGNGLYPLITQVGVVVLGNYQTQLIGPLYSFEFQAMHTNAANPSLTVTFSGSI